MLGNLISYYRACYQSDFRAINLINFFSTKVEDQFFLKEASLLEGQFMQVPVPTAWGEQVKKKLALYSKEKALYACSFFISGKHKVAGRTIQVFAPLYIHPAQLFEEEEVYYIKIEENNPIINPAFIKGLTKVEPGVAEYLSRNLPSGHIDFDEIDQIEKILNEVAPELDIEALEQYPKLYTEKEVQVLRDSTFQVVPAIGLGIIDKPNSSRGVLNELEDLSLKKTFSKPLEILLGGKENNNTGKPPAHLSTPVILSKAQQEIIKSAFKYDLSLAIGPPGAGKSFTIAALAIEFLVMGKSVLIASKNNQAVNVVADKIEGFGLEEIVVRAGKNDYKKKLKERIGNHLNGLGLKPYTGVRYTKMLKITDDNANLLQRLQKEVIKRSQKELKRGRLLSDQKGWFYKLRMSRLKKAKANELPFWKLMFQLERQLSKRNRQLREFIKYSFDYFLFQAFSKHRGNLKLLHKALLARTGNRKDELFAKVDFKKILEAFPIWVVNTADINKALPLESELFDIVILDEASQCDIASCLPILARAKRAVIIGDPKQLRHISFLSRKQQQLLIQKYDLGQYANEMLDYRENSILDLISDVLSSQEQIHFLDEHYRSMPDIIQFSNKHFYNDQLHVMTACPATLRKRHIFLNQVSGKRYKQGYNKVEAEAIIASIRQIIEKEQGLEAKYCRSIGIISPFRGQVDYLIKQVQQQFTTLEIERHRLLIGTPYTFQGEECDIVFISFALDQEAHPSAFQYLERPDVFNVSITRARSMQQVYISFDPTTLKKGSLLSKYLVHIQFEQVLQQVDWSKHMDVFTQEVLDVLKNIETITLLHTSYPIAGTEIDIVVVKDGSTYCIDLVGYPGAFEEALPLERWRMLERVGIETFTLDYSSWYLNRKSCITALKQFLAEK